MPVASDEERAPIRRQARRSGGREGCWSSRSARASLEATRGGGGNVGRGMEAAAAVVRRREGRETEKQTGNEGHGRVWLRGLSSPQCF